MDLPIYNKNNPFLATIKERYNLTKENSKKNTQHLVLDLKGSGYVYEVGDSIGIFPVNNKELVDKTLNAMHADGTELVVSKHTGNTHTLREFLTSRANITELSRKLLSTIIENQTNVQKKEFLQSLFVEGAGESLKAYLESHELWDALNENSEVKFSIQDLCNLLMPLLPRLYSISSSMAEVGEHVHLTVGVLKYSSNGHQRVGVCTHFLCDLMPMNEAIVPVYIQKHHGFTLPKTSDSPIIMIGPGTGVAPFRAFMQERMAHRSTGKNWLFFGECNKETDYYYEEYWTSLEKQGKLKVVTAFSRDQEEKIYVQHRMLEHGAEIYQWIMEGAYIYVCGDASRMAKDVEASLCQIIAEHGKKDEAETKAIIKALRSEKRYLRDVY